MASAECDRLCLVRSVFRLTLFASNSLFLNLSPTPTLCCRGSISNPWCFSGLPPLLTASDNRSSPTAAAGSVADRMCRGFGSTIFLRGVEQACGWWTLCLEAPGKGGGGSADTSLLALPLSATGTGEEDCCCRNTKERRKINANT